MDYESVTFTIDTYGFVHNLIEVGFTEKQARAVLDEIKKIQLNNVASRNDVIALKEDILRLQSTVTKDVADVSVKVSDQIRELQQSIVRWLIPMILGLYAFFGAISFHVMK